jgi:hypothetical protein
VSQHKWLPTTVIEFGFRMIWCCMVYGVVYGIVWFGLVCMVLYCMHGSLIFGL